MRIHGLDTEGEVPSLVTTELGHLSERQQDAVFGKIPCCASLFRTGLVDHIQIFTS